MLSDALVAVAVEHGYDITTSRATRVFLSIQSTAGVRLLGPQKKTRRRRAIVWYWIDNKIIVELFYDTRYLSFVNMKCKHHPSLKCGLWSTSECLADVNPHPYGTVLRTKFSFPHCRRTLTNRDVQEIRYTTQPTSSCHRNISRRSSLYLHSLQDIVSRFENGHTLKKPGVGIATRSASLVSP